MKSQSNYEGFVCTVTHPHTKFVYKLDISNHKTVLNEKFLITFSTSFKSLLNLNKNFQHKLSRVIQFKNKKI